MVKVSKKRLTNSGMCVERVDSIEKRGNLKAKSNEDRAKILLCRVSVTIICMILTTPPNKLPNVTMKINNPHEEDTDPPAINPMMACVPSGRDSVIMPEKIA